MTRRACGVALCDAGRVRIARSPPRRDASGRRSNPTATSSRSANSSASCSSRYASRSTLPASSARSTPSALHRRVSRSLSFVFFSSFSFLARPAVVMCHITSTAEPAVIERCGRLARAQVRRPPARGHRPAQVSQSFHRGHLRGDVRTVARRSVLSSGATARPPGAQRSARTLH